MKGCEELKRFLKNIKLVDVLFVIALGIIVCLFLSNRKNHVQEQFNDYTPNNNNEVNFVLFYADWCPHCQRLEPTWEELTNDLNGKEIDGTSVHITKVDCAKQNNKDTCEANHVSSYPTIKCFTANGVKEHEGERTYDALETFLHNVINNL